MFDAQAIIAEATAQAPKAEANALVQEAEATSEEAQVDSQYDTQEVVNAEKSEDVGSKPDSELTPEQLAKREENRQSHLNRKLAKQRFREQVRAERERNAQLSAELEKIRAQINPNTQQTQPNGKPDFTQFDNHLDYFDALTDWKLATKSNAEKEQSAPKADLAKVQRLQEMATREQEFAKSVPDYERLVYQDHAHVMNNMPKHVAEALLDAEDASLALYALAKEGALDDLEDLDGRQLDKVIAKAEERGKAYLSQRKTISSAPPPIESLKGTGRATKDLYSLSVEELLQKFNR